MSEKTGLSDLSPRRLSRHGSSIPEPSRKWVTRLALPILILVVVLALWAYTARDSLKPALDVRTVRVVTKSLNHLTDGKGLVTVQAPGWVEADPFPVYVPALASGVVKEVLVLEGHRVEAGQVVVKLIDDDARLALEGAEAHLKGKKAQLSAAQSNWDYPVDLDRMVAVARASLQQVRAEQIELRSEIVMQEAHLAELEDKHQRLEALLPDIASRQQVISAGLQRDARQAMVVAVRKRQAVLDARLSSARADLEAALEKHRLRIDERQELDRAKAEVEQAEALAAEAQLRLDRMNVRSPVSGIVMTRLAVPGSRLMTDMEGEFSANALHLYDPNRLQVRVDVPLVDAAKVGIDQETEIVVDVLPEKQFAGHVSRIVHEADIQKNTLEAKVAIHDPDPELKPEMLARVKFLGRPMNEKMSTSVERVFIPEAVLIQSSDSSATVWLYTVDGHASQREITLGTHRQEGWVEVLSGLQPSDILIASPLKELKEGQSVRSVGEAKL